ncbi:MAG: RIP metalloprotease RseP [Rickettsiales bacterium]|nr:RIP metalloprotease RseP [Rickettsiales bacterium]
MSFFLDFINFSEYIFWFVLVFSLIVFVHEYGHYYVAKFNDVSIEKFSIGFGPALISKKDKNGTIWQISIIPLGGYVKFCGEMYHSEETKSVDKADKRLFFNKSSLQKASIVLAGPIANFILGIFIFIFIYSFYGKNYTEPVIGNIELDSPASKSNLKMGDKILQINGQKIDSYDQIYEILDKELLKEIEIYIKRKNDVLSYLLVPDHKEIKTFIGSTREVNYLGISPLIKPIIGKTIKNSAADEAGLKKNDVVLKIDELRVFDIRQIIEVIKKSPNRKLNITIKRGEKTLYRVITPRVAFDNNGMEIGIIGVTFAKERIKLNFIDAVKYSIVSFIDVTKKTIIAFGEIIFGKRDHCEVGGPILIAKVSNDVANTDLISFAGLIALISINLGIINLFPFPLLDGGHFFTFMVEYLRGQRVHYKIYQYIQYIGVLLIGSLMLFSIINDIYCRVLN